MPTRITSVATLVFANLILGLAALGAVQALSATAALEDKLDGLTKDALKWNDRIALINEDMRIFPRCLENPGPNTPQLTDVYASSCAKTPAQAWILRKPYQ